MTNQDYDKYIRAEWDAFVRDPARSQASLDLVAGIPVTRVLDIRACGAGQEMVPFVDRGAFGVGLDVSPEVGLVGRRRFADLGAWRPGGLPAVLSRTTAVSCWEL